ncbi:MAG: hypothetical protein ACREBG_19600 [Pyrinomonadaceae bacterium]
MNRRVLTIGLETLSLKALFLLTVILPVFSAAPTQNRSRPERQAPPSKQQPRIDLNGVWVDNGNRREVTITHVGSMVKATYNAENQCSQGRKERYTIDFEEATLSGNTLVGQKMSVCVWGYANVADGTVQKVPMKLTVSAGGYSMAGTYGTYRGRADDNSVTFTRKCAPNKQKLCDAIANASRTLANARSTPTPRRLRDAALKQNLSGELSQMRNELCDRAAQEQIDKLMNTLESIDYVSEESWKLVLIENGLKSLSNESCKETKCQKYSGEITCDCNADGQDETTKAFESCGLPGSSYPRSFRSRCEDWIQGGGYGYSTEISIQRQGRAYLELLEKNCSALKCQRPYATCKQQAENEYQKCVARRKVSPLRPDCTGKHIAAADKCKRTRDRCMKAIN